MPNHNYASKDSSLLIYQTTCCRTLMRRGMKSSQLGAKWSWVLTAHPRVGETGPGHQWPLGAALTALTEKGGCSRTSEDWKINRKNSLGSRGIYFVLYNAARLLYCRAGSPHEALPEERSITAVMRFKSPGATPAPFLGPRRWAGLSGLVLLHLHQASATVISVTSICLCDGPKRRRWDPRKSQRGWYGEFRDEF